MTLKFYLPKFEFHLILIVQCIGFPFTKCLTTKHPKSNAHTRELIGTKGKMWLSPSGKGSLGYSSNYKQLKMLGGGIKILKSNIELTIPITEAEQKEKRIHS